MTLPLKRFAPAARALGMLMVALSFSAPSSSQGFYQRDVRGNINQINTGVEQSSVIERQHIEDLNRSDRTVNVRAFTRLVVRVPSEVIFVQGSPNKVELKGPPNVLRRIETSQNGNTLTIESRGGFQTSSRVRIIITGSILQDVDLEGIIKADLRGLRGAKFRIKASGTVEVAGRGEVSLCVLRISGASSADLRALRCGVADLNVLGASDVQLYASDRITGLVSGASEITVSGRPGERHLSTSGAVDVSYL